MASCFTPLKPPSYTLLFNKMSSPQSTLPTVMIKPPSESVNVFASVDHNLLDAASSSQSIYQSPLTNTKIESLQFPDPSHPAQRDESIKALLTPDESSSQSSFRVTKDDMDSNQPVRTDDAKKGKKRKMVADGNNPQGDDTSKVKSLKICPSCATVAETAKAKKCVNCQKFFYDSDDKGFKSDGTSKPKPRRRRRTIKLETLPGTSLKICSCCGAVAETPKAKKCQTCQKFFYDHWAQRCRVPPCPKCFYSRRARAKEKPPFTCDRCGFELPPHPDDLPSISTDASSANATLESSDSKPPEVIPSQRVPLSSSGNSSHPESLSLPRQSSSSGLSPCDGMYTADVPVLSSSTTVFNSSTSVNPVSDARPVSKPAVSSPSKSVSDMGSSEHSVTNKVSAIPSSGSDVGGRNGADGGKQEMLNSEVWIPGESKITLVNANASTLQNAGYGSHGEISECPSFVSMETPATTSPSKEMFKERPTGGLVSGPVRAVTEPLPQESDRVAKGNVLDRVQKLSHSIEHAPLFVPAQREADSDRVRQQNTLKTQGGLSTIESKSVSTLQRAANVNMVFSTAPLLNLSSSSPTASANTKPVNTHLPLFLPEQMQQANFSALLGPRISTALANLEQHNSSPGVSETTPTIPIAPRVLTSSLSESVSSLPLPTGSKVLSQVQTGSQTTVPNSMTTSTPSGTVSIIQTGRLNLLETMNSLFSSATVLANAKQLDQPTNLNPCSTALLSSNAACAPMPITDKHIAGTTADKLSAINPSNVQRKHDFDESAFTGNTLKVIDQFQSSSLSNSSCNPEMPLLSTAGPAMSILPTFSLSSTVPLTSVVPSPSSPPSCVSNESSERRISTPKKVTSQGIAPTATLTIPTSPAPKVTFPTIVPRVPTGASSLGYSGLPSASASPQQAVSQLLQCSQKLGVNFGTSLPNVPSLKKIKELVEMTVKQQHKQQQHQVLLQKQRQLLVDQLQTQIQIQKHILKSRSEGGSSTPEKQEGSTKKQRKTSPTKGRQKTRTSETVPILPKRPKKTSPIPKLSLISTPESELVTDLISAPPEKTDNDQISSPLQGTKDSSEQPSSTGVSIGIQTYYKQAKSSSVGNQPFFGEVSLACKEPFHGTDNTSGNTVEPNHSSISVCPPLTSSGTHCYEGGSVYSPIPRTTLTSLPPPLVSSLPSHNEQPSLSDNIPEGSVISSSVSSTLQLAMVESQASANTQATLSTSHSPHTSSENIIPPSSFQKIEVSSSTAYQIPGHDKIHVSLLRPGSTCSPVSPISPGTIFGSPIQSQSIAAAIQNRGKKSTSGTMKYQNFSLSHPKLSVIATVETQKGSQVADNELRYNKPLSSTDPISQLECVPTALTEADHSLIQTDSTGEATIPADNVSKIPLIFEKLASTIQTRINMALSKPGTWSSEGKQVVTNDGSGAYQLPLDDVISMSSTVGPLVSTSESTQSRDPQENALVSFKAFDSNVVDTHEAKTLSVEEHPLPSLSCEPMSTTFTGVCSSVSTPNGAATNLDCKEHLDSQTQQPSTTSVSTSQKDLASVVNIVSSVCSVPKLVSVIRHVPTPSYTSAIGSIDPSDTVAVPRPPVTIQTVASARPGMVTVQVCSSLPSNLPGAVIKTSSTASIPTPPSLPKSYPNILRPRVTATIGNVLVQNLSSSFPPKTGLNVFSSAPGSRTNFKMPQSHAECASLGVMSPKMMPKRGVFVSVLDTVEPGASKGFSVARSKLSGLQLTPLIEEEEERKLLQRQDSNVSSNQDVFSPGEQSHTTTKSKQIRKKKKKGKETAGKYKTSAGNGGESSNGNKCGAGEGDADKEGGHDAGGGKKDEKKGDKQNEPKKKKAKRTKPGPNGKKKKDKMKLFSVKLKDGFLHHLMWERFRVVFFVPLSDTEEMQSGSSSHNGTIKPGERSGSVEVGGSGTKGGERSGSVEVEGSGTKGGKPLPGGSERKTRRKAKIEPLVMHEMEEDLDPLLESPSTSSAHITSPCFSVYELRHKVFAGFTSNTVYTFTYKNDIKTLKPPLHWHHVLKRMGGVPESCHTCRLVELEHVKSMCAHHKIESTIPACLEELRKNQLPKGRKVIDLSDLEPDDLLASSEHLEEIPQCSFGPARKSKKTMSSHDFNPEDGSTSKSIDGSCDQSHDTGLNSPGRCIEFSPPPLTGDNKSHGQSHDQCTTNDVSYIQSKSPAVRNDKGQKLHVPGPPPLIKLSPLSSRNPNKKKFCPECGVQIARKSKKCYACGKRFGVFTFGRKLCPSCGRCNLARMTACFGCGFSLSEALKAVPEVADDSPTLVSKSSFLFGARKRRRIPSFHGDEGGSAIKMRKEQLHSISSAHSSRLPSTADTEYSLEQNEEFPDEEDMEGVANEDMVGVANEGMEGVVTETMEGVLNESMVSEAEGKLDEPTTPVSSSRQPVSSQKPSKHAGYQYGRIPWGDADVTCLVNEAGTPLFCLPELCSKVLRGHSKSDVFEIVKDLKLPVEHGDLSLLKKLQALGLHSNRSPMCRLIAAEELWALLDALQEQVPVEVHQHLETISVSTTPLMSPGGPSHSQGGLQSPALIPTGTTITEDEEHGFESTLHEVECSDGQSVAVLRAWNGEQFGSLTEIWRKYFPEVNRNHLTSALKRLRLETTMPTGQQATLLRNANVISLRGAAGRLMKFDDMQILLDDFSIPLQIGSSSRDQRVKVSPTVLSAKAPLPPPVSRSRKNSTYGLPQAGLVASATAQGKVIASKEDLLHADCMRNLLKAVDPGDLIQLLERAHREAGASSSSVDSENRVSLELDEIQQLILSRRELCNVLSNEVGYLTVTNHGFMKEAVRVGHTEKLVLQDLDRLLKAHDMVLK